MEATGARDPLFRISAEVALHCAHDLRNLLLTVLGHAELQRSRWERGELPADEDLFSSLEAISIAAGRAATLAEELLARARGETESVAPVSLAASARKAREVLKARSGLEASVELSGPEELTVLANPSRLERAILNLLWNALDAAQLGGGVPSAALQVRWGEGLEGPWLEVVDHGPGLGTSRIAELLQPASVRSGGGRVGSREKGPGMHGIGLHGVAASMSSWGGRLVVGSPREEEGAVLRLEFHPDLLASVASDSEEKHPVPEPRRG